MDKRDVVFYKVYVASGNKKWVVKRRHSMFKEFDAHMRQKHPNMPELPLKSKWRYLGFDIDIDEMKFYLEDYVQRLIKRPDMRTNALFRKFLEIDKHLPESVPNKFEFIGALTQLDQPPSDFIIVPEL